MEGSEHKIRVVVADDSAVMRRLLSDLLSRSDRIDVVGTAEDGDEAIEQCESLRPDVLTLDLSMPGKNGLEALEQLRADRSPVHVVVVSAFSPSLVERALDVLDAGATDLVAKPRPSDGFDAFGEQLRNAVIAAASGDERAARSANTATTPRMSVPRSERSGKDASRIVVIASSTGGPRALGDLIPALGRSGVGGGGVIVQHMPEGFTGPLARRLDGAGSLTVREAANGERLAPATLLVAPAGTHLRFDGEIARLDDSAPIGALRPRADVTIEDLVRAYGARVVLVVLTGMGSDALAGARAAHAAGGIVLAQDESDCVVYGMPRVVIEQDLAHATGTIPELAVLIERALATPVTA